MTDENAKLNFFPKWLIIIIAIFLVMLFFLTASLFIFDLKYKNKIYPNIFIGSLDLGGRDLTQAIDLLNKKVQNFNQNGIAFLYGDRQVDIVPLVSSAGGDIAYQIINFDLDNAVSSAYAYGRDDKSLANTKQKLALLFKRQSIPARYSANRQEIKSILAANFSGYEMPAYDAKLIFAANFDETKLNFSVEQEKNGRKINYDQGIDEMLSNLEDFDYAPITLAEKNDYPQILKKDCLNIDAKAQAIISLSPLKFRYEQNQFSVKKDELANLLGLLKNQDKNSDDKVSVGLDKIKAINYLNDKVAPKINREPVWPKFEIKNGKVETFQIGASGLKLDLEASLNNIDRAVAIGTSTISLAAREIKSDSLLASSSDNFGIKEIIGIGRSNFKGSLKNRRHNIATGANALNGVLIKPDEEFSLVKTLGDISSGTGYLPELVIKGNKTTPEYGGGLCQIGTTMFRTALASGLPITMRRNHSYRVTYYEPAGTDATIYDPLPDLRFINDTGNYILIQKRIEGDNLYFDFWGKSDGRIATQTRPVISKIVKPGPTKIIETLDLKPGEKKCSEIAHNGADAYFDYKVSYSDGEIKEKRFSSHYIPWQAVCLLGVEKLSTQTNSDGIATSTGQTN